MFDSIDIVNFVPQPILLLDENFHIAMANNAFLQAFHLEEDEVKSRPLFDLECPPWHITPIKAFLTAFSQRGVDFEACPIEYHDDGVGRRTMLLNARRVAPHPLILLAIEDISEQRRNAKALRESNQRLRVIIKIVADSIWEADPDGALKPVTDLWDSGGDSGLSGVSDHDWLRKAHSDDRDRALDEWKEALGAEREASVELRMRLGQGQYRWVKVRAAPLRDETDAVFKWLGITLDIDALKRAETEREMLRSELNHQVNNIFAVVQALAQGGDVSGTAAEYKAALLGRIKALADAQSLAFGGAPRHDTLRALVDRILGSDGGDGSGSIEIEGEPVVLTSRQMLSFSLVLRELLTNARKYGALSQPQGRVGVSWHVRDTPNRELCFLWNETGGPPLTEPKTRQFGTRLIEQLVTHELGGDVTLMFPPEGLRAVAVIPLS